MIERSQSLLPYQRTEKKELKIYSTSFSKLVTSLEHVRFVLIAVICTKNKYSSFAL
jgi:hypothetical protein